MGRRDSQTVRTPKQFAAPTKNHRIGDLLLESPKAHLAIDGAVGVIQWSSPVRKTAFCRSTRKNDGENSRLVLANHVVACLLCGQHQRLGHTRRWSPYDHASYRDDVVIGHCHVRFSDACDTSFRRHDFRFRFRGSAEWGHYSRCFIPTRQAIPHLALARFLAAAGLGGFASIQQHLRRLYGSFRLRITKRDDDDIQQRNDSHHPSLWHVH